MEYFSEFAVSSFEVALDLEWIADVMKVRRCLCTNQLEGCPNAEEGKAEAEGEAPLPEG